MKLLVCGSRTITDTEWVGIQIGNYVTELNLDTESLTIIEGEASGVDSIAKLWAEFNHCNIISVPADWKSYGKAAGYIRNKQMVELCDYCLILWDGTSKGTKHDIILCEQLNKPHKIIMKKGIKKND